MSDLANRCLALVVLSLTVASCSTPPQEPTDAERQALAAEVTAALDGLTQAINAHEPDRAMAFYADDPDFVALTCTSFITGGSTYKAMVGPTYGPRRGAQFEQRVVSVQVLSPTVAVASQQGGSDRAPILFWTRVLAKRDGSWVITYEHQSWPGCSPPPDPHPYTTPSDSAALRPGGIN